MSLRRLIGRDHVSYSATSWSHGESFESGNNCFKGSLMQPSLGFWVVKWHVFSFVEILFLVKVNIDKD